MNAKTLVERMRRLLLLIFLGLLGCTSPTGTTIQQKLSVSQQVLTSAADRIDAEVKDGKFQLISIETNTIRGTATSLGAVGEDAQRLQKKLDDANSAQAKMFTHLSWLAVVSIGLAVAAAIITHNFTLGVAGIAGGGAMLVVSLVAGLVLKLLPYIAGAVILFGIGLLLYEWKKNGLKAAIHKGNK